MFASDNWIAMSDLILRGETYRQMLAQDRHERPDAYLAACDQLFDGVELRGKTVLEIGSGTGLLSIYMALRGAQVTSLEPEMVGSTSGVLATQRARCEALGLSVESVAADFNTWQTDRTFDVIVARSTINHLYPSEHHARWDAPTWNGYVRMLRRVKGMLSPGGVFVASDAARYGFWRFVRKYAKQPWKQGKTGVNWRHHQNAATWAKLLRAAGFRSVERDYPVPASLRPIGGLFRNSLAAFWLKGAFIVRGR
jgi:SAM-dependent methyltransferase